MWYCVIQNPLWVGRLFADWFTSNTKAFWLVLFMNDKPYILRLSLLVNMEFVLPFKAPPIPIFIRLGLAFDIVLEGGGGRGFPLFCGCLVLWWGLHVLASGSRLIYLKFYFGKYRCMCFLSIAFNFRDLPLTVGKFIILFGKNNGWSVFLLLIVVRFSYLYLQNIWIFLKNCSIWIEPFPEVVWLFR